MMNNHKGKIAISEMSLLVFGFVAFACIIGNINFVSSISDSGAGWASLAIAGGISAGGVAGASALGVELATSAAATSQLGIGFAEGTTASAGGGIGVALVWAVIAYFIAQWLGPELGLDEDETEAFSWAAAGGTLVGVSVSGATIGSGTTISGLSATGIGLAVAVIIYFVVLPLFDKEYRVVTFSCNAWDSVERGENCELCNNQDLPCSEYQCRSLGQACEIVNPGTEEELCVWVDRNDILPPVIEPSQEELSRDFVYENDNAISPPDRGVKIINQGSNDGCIPAFTPLTFGVNLDKPAKCKVDPSRKDNFDDMVLFLSSGLKRYNHTISFSLPGTANLAQQGLEMQNGGNFELYIRCSDANGNTNTADFVFKYCVNAGPDTTPPQVRSSSTSNNAPIAFGQDSYSLVFYINEPAECKWSHQDDTYDNMPEVMNCVKNFEDSVEYGNEVVYPCSTTLTGIQDQQDNKFYIKCKDQPLLAGTDKESDRNTNTQSYEYNLIGTRELILEKAGPNETIIKDSAESVKVTLTAKTSAGFNEGLSSCEYAKKGDANYIRFFNTESYTHSTDIYLDEGEYEFNIRCTDLGGNSDSATIEFETESDSESPIIVRAYKSDNSLKIVTDESATCVYDTTSCNYLFEDGLYMITSSEINHFVDWSTKNRFYIKCKDEYGNEPGQSECSSIIRAID